MKLITYLAIATFAVLTASCSSSNKSETTINSSTTSSDSIAESKSEIWYWVNYDDGFGGSTEAKFLQATGVALYSDPYVEKREVAVYISVDPNIGKATLTFNNGENHLKGAGEMLLQIKDEDGKVYSSPIINNDDGLCFTQGEEDIILQLLKTEKSLGFRIEQHTYAGPIVITFQFPNDSNFNRLLDEIPNRDSSFYN